ncbi:MAG: accessory factor UbiK family protein [Pseudomonadota bacterium]
MVKPIVDALKTVIPPELVDDVEANLKSTVSQQFEKMNLVTREQIEVQSKILQRARERLEKLESQVHELEKVLNAETTPRKGD